jgi:CRISPR-associated protein Cmr2
LNLGLWIVNKQLISGKRKKARLLKKRQSKSWDSSFSLNMVDPSTKISSSAIAIAWCLAWGDGREPQYDLRILSQMKDALRLGSVDSVPQEVQVFVKAAQKLNTLDFPKTLDELISLTTKHPILWNHKIGLVYGGATKIKQYVFEAAKLPDIRGASALLDRINLADLPKFFSDITHPELIPELIIYSKGGNILAFCPAAFIDDLANAIETQYTQETLTANSCAVGTIVHPLEIRLGLLQEPIKETLWINTLPPGWRTHPILNAYFGLSEDDNRPFVEIFESRKNFSELVSKLATQFNLRRSGYDLNHTRSNCVYPPMLETHPYLRRDDSDRSSAVYQITDLPSRPWVSESLAHKRWIGQSTKQESTEERRWFSNSGLVWDAQSPESWVTKFKEKIPEDSHYFRTSSSLKLEGNEIQEARSLKEIGDVSNGFVAYIYADGNNMGQYIREKIKTPEQYRQFSDDVFQATEQSVYIALANHLEPHYYTPDAQSNRFNKTTPVWIHPFEIITIGGDDVLLIVPASKALAIAKTIGDQFEAILNRTGRYPLPEPERVRNRKGNIHRYKPEAPPSHCCLSISSGVLITAVDTPIYYADKLVSQLLKSAKKYAKELKEKHGFYGGTVDFLTLKTVTMISSNIEAFRREALTIKCPGHQLKLYAAPYTLHELGGLLKTAKTLKQSNFPKSQLYQIRSLLERGKRSAILNYRYFRVRLKKEQQNLLLKDFESVWCEATTNNGNIAPWLSVRNESSETTIYETFWRELVELEPFTEAPPDVDINTSSSLGVESEEVRQ